MKNIIMCMVMIAFLGACSTIKPLSIQDHPTRPLTTLQTLETTSFLNFKKFEHQFWLCKDEAETLNCTPECGGQTDYDCPAFMINGVSSSSNIILK